MPYPSMPEKIRKPRRPLSEIVPDMILAVLAVAGLVISGWSLGTLLHDQAGAPWWVAVFAVSVFDLVALVSGVLVYARRHDPWSAAGARVVMTLALAASSAVNGAHGYALGGWTTAAVLAAAPLSFEIVFELRHRTLTALVWVLFRREAFERLRLDAWRRIASGLAPEPTPEHSGRAEIVLTREDAVSVPRRRPRSVEQAYMIEREARRQAAPKPGPEPYPEGEAVPLDSIPKHGAHAPVVYFIRNGSRVKIGTSTSVRTRVGTLSLRWEDVLFVLGGGERVERGLHARFADYRVGNTEWFEESGSLAVYIAEQTGETPAAPEPAPETPESVPESPEPARSLPEYRTIKDLVASMVASGVTDQAKILATASATFPGAKPESVARTVRMEKARISKVNGS